MRLGVALRFAPLPRWILTWWRGSELALALDVTGHGDRLVVPAIGTLEGGTAIPVAWHALPANREGMAPPRLHLPDLLAPAVGVAWYGLRVRIELGFKAPKRLGWRWQRTRRGAPDRVARHWLVLAVATPWTVAVGARAEGAAARETCPTRRWRAATGVRCAARGRRLCSRMGLAEAAGGPRTAVAASLAAARTVADAARRRDHRRSRHIGMNGHYVPLSASRNGRGWAPHPVVTPARRAVSSLRRVYHTHGYGGDEQRVGQRIDGTDDHPPR